MNSELVLKQAQVDAAIRLHERLEGWRNSDVALMRLRDSMPEFDSASCLLKTVAVNALYGTQVLALVRMAGHVATILQASDTVTDNVELVEKLAMLPGRAGGKYLV